MTVEDRDTIEFVLEDDRGVSSDEFPAHEPARNAETEPALRDDTLEIGELDSLELPRLDRRDRARLQMQSPTRLFFYWSIAPDPFRRLNRALGSQTADYTLVLKLVNLDAESEELHRVEEEGSIWFNVDADKRYRAEIGFYSPTRPFVRILFSNTVATPRKNPSPRTAETAHWKVTSDRFARILDVSGFTHDAFDVALAGDRPEITDSASRAALAELTGDDVSYADLEAQEIRLALLLIASGADLESLRPRLGAKLFAVISASGGRFGRDDVFRVMTHHFALDEEVPQIEEPAATVFGSSVMNFPRRLRTKLRVPKEYAPVGSFSVGRR